MKLSPSQLSLMGMLIALNVAIGGVVHVTKIPIFLDAIGTIIAVLLLGLLPGVIVGVITFVVAAVLINPVYIWFIGTQAVLALAIYLMASRLSVFSSPWRAAAGGLALGIITGIVSAPVIVMVFGGVAGSGRDLVTAALVAAGNQVYTAVFASGAASEPTDKLLQVLAALFILRGLPKGLLAKFRNPVLVRNGLL